MEIDWRERGWLALPEEMAILEKFANQPANIRSRKPARLVWLYTLGIGKAEIISDLKVPEKKLEQYFQRWIDYGVRGVTGYAHPELPTFLYG